MGTSTLLISCAMPLARVPTVSSRCFCSSRLSSAARSSSSRCKRYFTPTNLPRIASQSAPRSRTSNAFPGGCFIESQPQDRSQSGELERSGDKVDVVTPLPVFKIICARRPCQGGCGQFAAQRTTVQQDLRIHDPTVQHRGIEELEEHGVVSICT